MHWLANVSNSRACPTATCRSDGIPGCRLVWGFCRSGCRAGSGRDPFRLTGHIHRVSFSRPFMEYVTCVTYCQSLGPAWCSLYRKERA